MNTRANSNTARVAGQHSTGPRALVHPGAFCFPLGATGYTSAGTKMICSDHSASGAPYANGAHRWRSA